MFLKVRGGRRGAEWRGSDYFNSYWDGDVAALRHPPDQHRGSRVSQTQGQLTTKVLSSVCFINLLGLLGVIVFAPALMVCACVCPGDRSSGGGHQTCVLSLPGWGQVLSVPEGVSRVFPIQWNKWVWRQSVKCFTVWLTSTVTEVMQVISNY